jgi:hypothetical protein
LIVKLVIGLMASSILLAISKELAFDINVLL